VDNSTKWKGATLRIAKVEDLHAEGNFKALSFLKITTDDGLVGWSEYSEFYGSQGITQLIRRLAQDVIGLDPRNVAKLNADIYAKIRVADGGLNAQAVAAIENACLDIKAKALGVPVYELLGGAIRTRLPVYWSHCATYRLRGAQFFNAKPVTSLNDIKEIGAEVARKGYKALKTNLILFDAPAPRGHSPGFGFGAGHPELNADDKIIRAAYDQMAAFRAGAGPGVGLMLDLNFNYKMDGYKRIAKALEPLNLKWLEIDTYDAEALAIVRSSTTTPIASLEALYGRRHYRPFFEKYAVDYAIIDPIWNGLWESAKIAALADTYGVNVNSHAFTGHLGFLMGAHLCAAIPNFHILEMDVDQMPWHDALFTDKVVIENGELVLPTKPGWGIDIDEEAVKAHPPGSASAWLSQRK
jgi:L-alanine-DL-glutamate epimerase-like enolase superfamily enzyme